MFLPIAKRFYALNDRTINLLMKGNIDMSATIPLVGEVVHNVSFSDTETIEAIRKEKEVEMFVVDKNRTRAGGSFFPYLNITIFDLAKYGIFKSVDRHNYKHNCLFLALGAGGLSDIKLQQLVLTLKTELCINAIYLRYVMLQKFILNLLQLKMMVYKELNIMVKIMMRNMIQAQFKNIIS